jgi:hypothetical protein
LSIDFDGLGSVLRVPVGADNYGGLAAKTALVYAGARFYYGRQADRPAQLKIFGQKCKGWCSL